MVSEDLREFCLMDMSGLTDEQPRRTLGQVNDEYVWEDMVNVLMIQLDQPFANKPAATTTGSSSSEWTRALHVAKQRQESVEEEDWHDPNESEEVLLADVGEMQHAMEVMDIGDMQSNEVEVMAAEMQKFGVDTSQRDARWRGERQPMLISVERVGKFGCRTLFRQDPGDFFATSQTLPCTS